MEENAILRTYHHTDERISDVLSEIDSRVLIKKAEKLNIPVLCLYRPDKGNRLSAMVSGNAIFTCREYTVYIEAQKCIDDFIQELT